MIDSQHWQAVIQMLREYAGYYRGKSAPAHLVNGLIQDLANRHIHVPGYSVWLIMHELARTGVVITGQRTYLNYPDAEARLVDIDQHLSSFNWPYFTITPFGLEYLSSTK